jgi:hypothetical protein
MSKINKPKTPIPTKSTGGKEVQEPKADFAFGKENYQLLVISAVVVIIGYILMAGGKPTDPNVFNEAVFSTQRITIAPLVVLAGYAIGVYAIVKKAA